MNIETSSQSGPVHVWEKAEITLHAANAYENPYTDVDVWVDLQGPGFQGRVYGFWDGDDLFRVRVLATTPGEWRWTSGANVADSGLRGQSGAFRAEAWSEAEKEENACRRGFLCPTANGHAIEYADGTPCFLLGDTWWSTPTFRYRWDEDGIERPIGPEMGFKDMVRLRRSQGYNCIAMIAAFPNWANDGHPPNIVMDDPERTGIRSAWRQEGTQSAKDMHNEGGRPFRFPGRVPGYEDVYPDMDRINPAYFRYMDRKVDYLNEQGFIPFIEVSRRDASMAWARFYEWPASYTRYIQYVWTRYQANNCIFSPIHFDSGHLSIPSRVYNEAANAVVDKGIPAFGTLRSCNAAGSSLINFGDSHENKWLTLHQIGNMRHHNSHWLLTQIYHESQPPRPALNGEPYYAGWPPGTPIPPGSAEADMYCRSGMYGSFLSGGLAGHIYGGEALWGGDIEPEAPYKMWDALQWRSGAQMPYLRQFAMSEGLRYQELVPDAQLVCPNQTHECTGNRGWAYCARTPDKSLFMVYFETDCPQSVVRGALHARTYHAQWFNPRDGSWTDIGQIAVNQYCEVKLPPQPSSEDWALKLTLVP